MSARRVAVVTGGATGLGRASALRMVEAGRAIAIWDLDLDGALRTATEVRQRGAEAHAVEVDVASLDALTAAHQATTEALGQVDILVNAAAIIGLDASVLETPLDEWDRVLAVNLTGTYLASRMVVGGMAERGWGRIVNFTSGARHGTPALIPYAVSKAGVVPITRAFAREFTARGVLVNAVLPGRALTNMVVSRVPEEIVRKPPVAIGRYADPEEVAEVVAFLASERNTYMSGGIVPVDGGG
ncbi:MAG: SDR family oxidoreductase [Chloroflexi bacterium]|nr:SDR family oxidoreductase [Chloroflexota bacterium]